MRRFSSLISCLFVVTFAMAGSAKAENTELWPRHFQLREITVYGTREPAPRSAIYNFLDDIGDRGHLYRGGETGNIEWRILDPLFFWQVYNRRVRLNPHLPVLETWHGVRGEYWVRVGFRIDYDEQVTDAQGVDRQPGDFFANGHMDFVINFDSRTFNDDGDLSEHNRTPNLRNHNQDELRQYAYRICLREDPSCVAR